MNRKRCDYDIWYVDPDKVFIIDADLGRMSVTNDAEAVVKELHQRLPGRRVIYRDSMKEWGELLTDGQGNFTGFGPFEANFS